MVIGVRQLVKHRRGLVQRPGQEAPGVRDFNRTRLVRVVSVFTQPLRGWMVASHAPRRILQLHPDWNLAQLRQRRLRHQARDVVELVFEQGKRLRRQLLLLGEAFAHPDRPAVDGPGCVIRRWLKRLRRGRLRIRRRLLNAWRVGSDCLRNQREPAGRGDQQCGAEDGSVEKGRSFSLGLAHVCQPSKRVTGRQASQPRQGRPCVARPALGRLASTRTRNGWTRTCPWSVCDNVQYVRADYYSTDDVEQSDADDYACAATKARGVRDPRHARAPPPGDAPHRDRQAIPPRFPRN